MARTVRDANLETRAGRNRLVVRREPHWKGISQGAHIGYRRGKRGGTWVARYLKAEGGYAFNSIGVVDDVQDADGAKVLSFDQAQAVARKWFEEQARKDSGLDTYDGYTVADAIRDYIEEDYVTRGRSLRDIQYRIDAFILPELGNIEIAKLSPRRLLQWRNKLASTPPRLRTRNGQDQKYREATDDPDALRKRQHSANKVLTILKSALNYAWRQGRVASDDSWRRVSPFKNVDKPRVRILSPDEIKRLANSTESDFRPMVQAALLTGCRYGELTRLRAADYIPGAGTLQIAETKTGKVRTVVLTDEGQEFFDRMTAGKTGNEFVFLRPDGKPWGKSHQARPLVQASARAKIDPAITFHILRHAYASQLVQAGVPLKVVSQNLGHADTRMTERHYSHLAPSYIADAIRASAPTMGVTEPDNVTSINA